MLGRERDSPDADEGVWVEHGRADERHCRLGAIEDMLLQRVEEQAWPDLDRWMDPDGRVDDARQVASEMA